MKQRSDYIGILDGIRAYSILIVAGFHLWQQSWLQNLFPSNLLQFMGVRNFSKLGAAHGLHVCRCDAAAFGILPLLPYARQMTDPLAPEPDNLRTFFKKRAARILPSYYLCLLLYLIFWVRPSDYANVKQYLQDIFAHLTFTQTFWPEKLHRHKISDSTVDTRRGNAVLPRLPFARARVPSLSACVLGGAFRFSAGVYRAFCTSAARQRRKPAHQPAPGIFGCICKRYAVCALLLPPADMARARMEEKPYFTACGADVASVQRCCHCVYVK